MSQSDAVAAVVTRFFDVLTKGDVDAVPSLLPEEGRVIGIGTDPGEWWDGRERLIEVMQAQVKEMSGLTVDVGAISAFDDGNLGWAVAQPSFRFPDGNSFGARLTVVAARSGNEWRAVHFHLSVGVSNEETVGKELTT